MGDQFCFFWGGETGDEIKFLFPISAVYSPGRFAEGGELGSSKVLLLSLRLVRSRFLVGRCSIFRDRFGLRFAFHFRLRSGRFFQAVRYFLLSCVSGHEVRQFRSVNVRTIMDRIFRYFRVRQLCAGRLGIVLVMERYGTGYVRDFRIVALRTSFGSFVLLVRIFQNTS